MTIRRRAAGLLIAGVAVGLALGGCKILPIESKEPSAAAAASRAAATDALWTEKALPHFTAAAKPVAEVVPAITADLGAAGAKYGFRQAAEGAPWTFVLAGEGTVAEKNTKSRAGTLLVTVAGLDQPVTLQIGPVIRGNAVRDSLPFVSFEDFDNQLDYAEMGKSLNAAALKGIEAAAAGLDAGAAVTFVGVASLAGKTDKMLVTPVILKAK